MVVPPDSAPDIDKVVTPDTAPVRVNAVIPDTAPLLSVTPPILFDVAVVMMLPVTFRVVPLKVRLGFGKTCAVSL
jgi:hypothetical protein